MRVQPVALKAGAWEIGPKARKPQRLNSRGKQRATSVNRSSSQPAATSSGRPPLPTPTNSAPTARGRAASFGLSRVGMAFLGLSLDRGSSSQAAPADDSAQSRLVWPGLFGGQARPTATPVSAPLPVAAADGGALLAPSDAPAVGGTLQESRGRALLAHAVERGHVPLRDAVATLTTTVKQLVEMVNNIRLGYEVLARGHECVLTGVVLLRVDTAKGFKDIMTTLVTGRSQVVERTGGGSAEDVVLTAIAETKRLVRVNLHERTAHAVRSLDVCVGSNRGWLDIIRVASEVLGGTVDEAADWLMAFMAVPSRKEA